MLKKTISYVDFDDNKKTEDFYFNLTKAEVAEMEVSVNGGLSKMIQQIIKTEDKKEIVAILKDVILRAYGEKTLDGKRFMKTKEIRESFASTEAYSELFISLANNSEMAAEFFNGIIPNN